MQLSAHPGKCKNRNFNSVGVTHILFGSYLFFHVILRHFAQSGHLLKPSPDGGRCGL